MTLGATLATDEVAAGVSGGGAAGAAGAATPLMHGPTFMANPLACAVAAASLELLLSSPWQRRVGEIQAQLAEQLAPCADSAAVREVRTLGAIGVVEMREPLQLQPVTSMLVERGVWLRPFGRLLYTMPPFVMTAEDLARVAGAMRDVVHAVERRERERTLAAAPLSSETYSYAPEH